MSRQSSMGSLVESSDQDAPRPAGGSSNRAAAGWREHAKVGGSIVAIIAAIVILAFQLLGGGDSAGSTSRLRDAIDSETGELFEQLPIQDGKAQPWKNPKTGKNTLYMAEKCHWTKDGKAKLKPTFVILNKHTGKSGDTLCPDCGRKVVPHNPMPPMDLIEAAAKLEAAQQGK